MVQEERSPALRWWAPVSGHVLGNRSLADIDAELEELSMDARSAPERICQAHLADQLPNFQRQKVRNPARCQRITVSGSMIATASRMRGAIRYKQTKIRRSKLLRTGRLGALRRSTFS